MKNGACRFNPVAEEQVCIRRGKDGIVRLRKNGVLFLCLTRESSERCRLSDGMYNVTVIRSVHPACPRATFVAELFVPISDSCELHFIATSPSKWNGCVIVEFVKALQV